MRVRAKKHAPRIALIASIVCMMGCAPRFINGIDGYPQPDEMGIAWSSGGEIAAQWFFTRWHPKEKQKADDSDHVDYPDHLSSDVRNILPGDTSYVVVNLRIYNPNRRIYRLARAVTVGNESEEEPVGWWTAQERQDIVIPSPVVANKEIVFAVRVISGDKERFNESIISTEDLRYTVQPNEPTLQEGGENDILDRMGN